MTVDQLYSELINNPFSPKIYRRLVKAYLDLGDISNSEAFSFALSEKFNVNNTDTNQEQHSNNSELS